MKDFLKGALVIGGMLALVMGVRLAASWPLHHEAMAVTDPAPIAAADGGCSAQQVKMPCLQPTDIRN